ncbi:hypothetical protein ACTXT7_007414 [Hymenolepis weldensis]
MPLLPASRRKEALHPKFPRCQATRLKLSANELQKFIILGATQTQRFYQTRILPRLQLLNKNPEEWWSRRGLRTDDYSEPDNCISKDEKVKTPIECFFGT